MTDPLLELSSDALHVTIAPLGAEMQSLRTVQGADLLWHGDPAFWTGRAPMLFPIVGRAVGDVIEAGGQRAEMKQHGFARRSVFALESATETTATHVLRANTATRSIYPFEFVLRVTHTLEGPALAVTAEIENAGDQTMPFGFGFHPAFRWPLPHAEDAPHVITLANRSAPMRRPLRSDGLLEAHLVPGPFIEGVLEIEDALFADGALVFPSGTSDLSYGPRSGKGLHFTFHNLPDLALWRPMGAPFLCIEPWHGTASHIGDGPNIAKRPNSLHLAPGAQVSFGYRVTYDA